MIRSGLLSFNDMGPNVQENQFPKHGNIVNMIYGEIRVYDANSIIGDLLKMHVALCKVGYCSHEHAACNVCRDNTCGCDKIKSDLHDMMDRNLIQVIRMKDEPEVEVNAIYGPPREVKIRDVNETNANLVNLHAEFNFIEGQEVHQYSDYLICTTDHRGCDVVKRDIQFLLNEGIIQIVVSRVGFNNSVNMIEESFDESDNEYVSADEYFSADDSGEEAYVNVIMPHFDIPTPVEVTYYSKPPITPLVISLLGPVPYSSNKVVPYK